MRLYLAGPLFSQAERRWLRELGARLVEAGHSIFLPQDDAEAPLRRDPPDFHGVFEACKVAIERSDALIAVLDGSDTDSGTAWECGYAYARAKPVIGLRTDLRGGEDQGLNLMLRRSCTRVIDWSATDESLDDLATTLLSALEKPAL